MGSACWVPPPDWSLCLPGEGALSGCTKPSSRLAEAPASTPVTEKDVLMLPVAAQNRKLLDENEESQCIPMVECYEFWIKH